MHKRKKIAIAFDFSEPSRFALPEAVRVARDGGAELVLVHVMPVGLTTDDRRGIFQSLRGELARFHEVDSRVCLEEGEPSTRIAGALDREGAELAVLGTHARKGIEHALLGSVAEEMIRSTRTPLLIVRGGKRKEPRPATRVVVGVDFSPASFEARRVAETIARVHHTAVRLVHVLPSSTSDLQREHAVNRIEIAARGMRLRGLEVLPVVTWGDPAAALVAELEGDPYGIVAVGTRDRGRMRRWLLGSVAEEVLRHAPGPVLIAHAPEARVEEEVSVPDLDLAFTD